MNVRQHSQGMTKVEGQFSQGGHNNNGGGHNQGDHNNNGGGHNQGGRGNHNCYRVNNLDNITRLKGWVKELKAMYLTAPMQSVPKWLNNLLRNVEILLQQSSLKECLWWDTILTKDENSLFPSQRTHKLIDSLHCSGSLSAMNPKWKLISGKIIDYLENCKYSMAALFHHNASKIGNSHNLDWHLNEARPCWDGDTNESTVPLLWGTQTANKGIHQDQSPSIFALSVINEQFQFSK